MTTTIPLFTSDGKRRRITLDNNRPVAEQVNEILDVEEEDDDDDESLLSIVMNEAADRLSDLTGKLKEFESQSIFNGPHYEALVQREQETRRFLLGLFKLQQ